MDYTFTKVNEHSLDLAPFQAMQFGNTLQWVLQRLAYANPAFGPPLLAKFDLSDGYYRIPLSPEAALELALVLPPLENQPPLVGIPLCLPMGWKLSPPYFCSFTETATDLANQDLTLPAVLPPHPLEDQSQLYGPPNIIAAQPLTEPAPHHHLAPNPMTYVDVYMDDFIGLAQPDTTTKTLRSLLWNIHKIFRHNPHPDDKPTRKSVLSSAKLEKGDGHWSTQKNILGWLIDTTRGSLHLPPIKLLDSKRLLTSTYLLSAHPDVTGVDCWASFGTWLLPFLAPDICSPFYRMYW
jgi:hypothetical protein